MKRLMSIGVFFADYLTAMATLPHGTVGAQAPAQEPWKGGYPGAKIARYPGGPPAPRVEPGQWKYWSDADIKKTFLVPGEVSTTLAFAPQYRLNINRREYWDPPRPSTRTKQPSHWGDPEMHADMTQIYWMIGGTGAIALGGQPANPDGTGAIQGAKIQRVKPGDIVLIAPYTWHQNQPDPGQQLTYGMCHVETRTTIP